MTRRWIFILGPALLVSLGLNLFLGGMVTARWAAPGEPGRGWDRRGFNPHAASDALPPELRDEVRGFWKEQRRANREKMRAARDARRAMFEVLTADTFDPEKLRAAHQALLDRTIDARRAVGEATIAIAEMLPDEARRAYFAAGRSGRTRK